MKRYDYRQKLSEPGVELIVRRNNQYGGAPEGATVLVDASEARVPSTISACMTLAEKKAIDERREAHRRALEEARAAKVRTSASSAIAALLERDQGGEDDELQKQAAEQASRRAADEALETERIVVAADARAAAEHAESPSDNVELPSTKSKRSKKQ